MEFDSYDFDLMRISRSREVFYERNPDQNVIFLFQFLL